MPGIIWTRPAIEDLDRLFRLAREQNPEGARKAAIQIGKAVHGLTISPRIGKPVDGNTARRECATSFGKNGYILRYMADNDRVVIIRVWHYLEKRSS